MACAPKVLNPDKRYDQEFSNIYPEGFQHPKKKMKHHSINY